MVTYKDFKILHSDEFNSLDHIQTEIRIGRRQSDKLIEFYGFQWLEKFSASGERVGKCLLNRRSKHFVLWFSECRLNWIAPKETAVC